MADRLPWRARWAVLCLLAAGLFLAGGACSGRPEPAPLQELYIFTWEDYFAPDTVENFQRESGIKVTVETFGSEEEMLAGLQSQPGRYDLVVASDSMVWTLRQLKLLTPLNRERIPNFAHIMERFRSPPCDPGNRYSMPYLWGTTGLALNTKHIPQSANSWKVLWDPAYAGRVAMLSDPQEVLGVALLTLGHSLNSREPLHLEVARQKLLEQKRLLAGYMDPMTIVAGLVSGELWVAQLYSGDALVAAEQNPNVKYIIPVEGGALWVDNLLIPIGALHKEEAETFINYILRPQVGADIVNHLYYASPNQEAQAYIRQDILENGAIYPQAETLSRLQHYLPLDEETSQRLNRIWAELQNP